MTNYSASERKKRFRDRIKQELKITEVGKPTRGSIWAYETPNGIVHIWLHFDRNYEWWKVCSRPQSKERFRRPVLHGFLGPKPNDWHLIPHAELMKEFQLSYAEEQIQVHQGVQPARFEEYRDTSAAMKYSG